MKTSIAILAGILATSGCSTVGTVGMITKSSSDPLSVVQTPQHVKELGPAQGSACRYFILAAIPFGASDLQKAVDRALLQTGAQALVNVAVESSLYGFIPIYNVFSFTCTTVKGTAVKFEPMESAGTSSIKS